MHLQIYTHYVHLCHVKSFFVSFIYWHFLLVIFKNLCYLFFWVIISNIYKISYNKGTSKDNEFLSKNITVFFLYIPGCRNGYFFENFYWFIVNGFSKSSQAIYSCNFFSCNSWKERRQYETIFYPPAIKLFWYLAIINIIMRLSSLRSFLEHPLW